MSASHHRLLTLQSMTSTIIERAFRALRSAPPRTAVHGASSLTFPLADPPTSTPPSASASAASPSSLASGASPLRSRYPQRPRRSHRRQASCDRRAALLVPRSHSAHYSLQPPLHASSRLPYRHLAHRPKYFCTIYDPYLWSTNETNRYEVDLLFRGLMDITYLNFSIWSYTIQAAKVTFELNHCFGAYGLLGRCGILLWFLCFSLSSLVLRFIWCRI